MFYGIAQESIPRFQEALRAVLAIYPRHFAQDMLITLDRNMGFYEDSAFMQAFKGEAGKDQESSLLWRLHVLAWAADHCRHLEGDFVECGVFEGFSTAVLARYLDFAKLPKRWYLYDTFAGIPEHQLNSNASNPVSYTDPGLHARVTQRFQAYPNIQVIRGQVPEVLPGQSPQRIAFMHIDMNSADAELGALEHLFGRMVPGGVLILDDYGWFYYREQKYVEDAYFQRLGYHVLELPTGQGMVIRR